MSVDRNKKEEGCCYTACRCLFGYFPWIPLISCSAAMVFIIFWKLSVDSAASQTRSLLTEAGLQLDTANAFLENCTTATSVLSIVTISVLGVLLVLSVFKGHQKALQDALYGQGPMPARYYWTHLCFALILSGLLLVLVLAFIAALVGVALWLSGAAAAESAATSSSRVYLHNAKYASVSDDLSNTLSQNYTGLRPNLESKDQVAVDGLFNNFMSVQKEIGFPMQGTCKMGCIDLKELSDMVEKPLCKCSSGEILKMAQQAKLVQEDLRFALGSIGLAVVCGLLLLMNVSSRITDTRRDLADEEVQQHTGQYTGERLPKHAPHKDVEAGMKQVGHTSLDSAPSSIITPSGAAGVDLANAWRQRVVPTSDPEPELRASRTPARPTKPSTTHHSQDSSNDLLNSLSYLSNNGNRVTTTPPTQSASFQRSAPAPIVPPSSPHHSSLPASPAPRPLLAGAAASSAAATTPTTAATTPLASPAVQSSMAGSVDLKDGWKSIARRYESPATTPKAD